MSDYEFNFYLPLKGFTKPIYGIPGNHDWFDALEGFNANFLEPRAARTAMAARVEADYHLTSTSSKRIETLIGQAARMRRLYGVEVATQRAPFFELQTDHFALIAIDTGILRSVDERQWAWLERALARSRGKFIMAIVGHPRFAGGRDVSIGDEKFSALYRLLRGAGVAVAMAGDTHDFEYYGERVEDGARLSGKAFGGRFCVLSKHGRAARQVGSGNPVMEKAGLVLDQVARRMAVRDREPVGRVRFQLRAFLPKLHGGAGRKLEQSRGVRSAWPRWAVTMA